MASSRERLEIDSRPGRASIRRSVAQILPVHPEVVGEGRGRRAAASPRRSGGARTAPRPCPPAEGGRGCRSATTSTKNFGMHRRMCLGRILLERAERFRGGTFDGIMEGLPDKNPPSGNPYAVQSGFQPTYRYLSQTHRKSTLFLPPPAQLKLEIPTAESRAALMVNGSIHLWPS